MINIELHLYIYCKLNAEGKVYYMSAYKYLSNTKDLTPSSTTFVYSYKAKRYVQAALYFISWDGKSRINFVPDRDMFRMCLRAKGMDIR